jgi:ribosome biogenesis GTPase
MIHHHIITSHNNQRTFHNDPLSPIWTFISYLQVSFQQTTKQSYKYCVCQRLIFHQLMMILQQRRRRRRRQQLLLLQQQPANNYNTFRLEVLMLILVVGVTLSASSSKYHVSCFVATYNNVKSNTNHQYHHQQQTLSQRHQRITTRSSILIVLAAMNEETASSTAESLLPQGSTDNNANASRKIVPADDDDDQLLQALGWQKHFAKQIDEIVINNNDGDDDDGDDDDNKNITPTTTTTATTALIPLRVTEVRKKSIRAVGAGCGDHERVIPITSGQKIINANEETVVVAGDWILVEETEEDEEDEKYDDDNDNESISISSSSSSNSEEEEEEEEEEEKSNNSNNKSPPRIRKILIRNSVLKRRAPGRNIRKTQLIAANLDTVFIVSSCNQDFNVARLERYIAMVMETKNVNPVIVLTKKDLVVMDDDDDNGEDDDGDDADNDVDSDDNDDSEEEDDDDDEDYDSSWLLDFYLDEATSIAGGLVPVVCLNACNREEATSLLAPWLGPGQTVAFVGSSGVGKSTLANTLCGTEVAPVGDIHTDSGQGRHTTTRRQLHFIQGDDDTDYTTENDGRQQQNRYKYNNGAILDTPGLRELQLVDATQGIDVVFSDLVDLARECKFRDCRHEGEPGCAIAESVESGAVDGDRVARWEKLVAENRLNSSEVAEGKKERERKKALDRKTKKKSNDTARGGRNNNKVVVDVDQQPLSSIGGGDRDVRKQAKKKRN